MWKIEVISDNQKKITLYKGFYELSDTEGNLYTTNSLPSFSKEFNLNVSALRKVSEGKFFKHKGWIVKKNIDISIKDLTHYYIHPNIQYNYFLIDPAGNYYETLHLKEFCKNNNLGYSGILRVCTGERKQCYKWTGYREKILTEV